MNLTKFFLIFLSSCLFSLNTMAYALMEPENTCRRVGLTISGYSRMLNWDATDWDNHYRAPVFQWQTEEHFIFKRYANPSPIIGTRIFLGSLNTIYQYLSRGLRARSWENIIEMIEQEKLRLTHADKRKLIFPLERGSDLNINFNSSFIPAACLSALSFNRCRKAMRFLLKSATPYRLNGLQIIFKDLLHKVLNDQRHQAVMRSVGISLLEDAKSYFINGTLPSDDIYQRLYVVAKSMKYSEDVSHRIAMETLGAYAIRGAGFAVQLPYFYLKDLTAGRAFAMIATAISFFDKVKFHESKELFSLPSQHLSTTCLYGKPYHFWLSAYMSFHLRYDGNFPRRTSLISSLLYGVGYEVGKKSGNFNGRDRYFESIISSQSLMDLDVRNAKMDNTFRLLGASFGINYDKNLRLDGDAILLNSFQTGRPAILSAVIKLVMEDQSEEDLFAICQLLKTL